MLASLNMWYSLVLWLRSFRGSSFIITILRETVRDMLPFMAYYFIFIGAFATCIYLSDPERDVMVGDITYSK